MFMPHKKELAFFENGERYKGKGIEGYKESFKGAKKDQVVGERTANYLWVSNNNLEWGNPGEFRVGIPRRVLGDLGKDIKLIAILRNPIDRALSAFLHHKRRGRVGEGETIGKRWEKAGMVHIGFYLEHLREWNKFFPKECFYVTTYERLFSDSGCLLEIENFLEISEVPATKERNTVVHEGIGFYNEEGEAYDSENNLIATKEEIENMRTIFQVCNKDLKKEWGVPVEYWRKDFNNSFCEFPVF